MVRVALLIASAMALASSTGAQSGNPATRGARLDVSLTLSEGTSMAAAVSPDGRTIAIDLLGALWTVSVEGGPAARILDDGYDAHTPAWSPDGQRLAFQAYRDNNWSIWTVGRDGTGLQRETSGAFDDREPHWSPDGHSLAFSSDRSGNYDVWTIDLARRTLRQITRSPDNEFMPAWSSDGQELVYVSDRAVRGVYATALGTRTERLLHADARTLAGPSANADGQLAYVAIDGPVSHLVVVRAGEAHDVASSGEDVFPFRPSWLRSGELLYTADGVIKRRRSAGGPEQRIAFAATVAFARHVLRARQVNAEQDSQNARGLMRPAISPDGSRVVFAALGDLWIAPAQEGRVTPSRLTDDAYIETDPAWSPDGTRVAFSTDRSGTMEVWIRDMRTGTDRRLASQGMSAAWSPDGRRLAFLDFESRLQIVDVASGTVRQAHDRLLEPSRPSWLPGGRAVVIGALKPYSTRFREGTNQILMVPVDTSSSRSSGGSAAGGTWFNPLPHTSIGMREDLGPSWSPDGKLVAAIVDGRLTVLPVDSKGIPLGKPRQMASDIANSPSWTADSRRLLYQFAEGFGLANLADGSIRRIVPELPWTIAQPQGSTVVHAGRLFDARSTALVENVDIIIQGNRIARVAPHHDDQHNGTIVDASNRTVLPGLIESHTHLVKSYGEALGRIWLAFGITSIRNPAANAFEALEDREAIAAGVRVGPRVFTAGEPFDGSRVYYPGGVSLRDGPALAERMARASALRFDFIKTYVRLPDLLQQQVIDAAHRAGLPVTSHEIYPAAAYGADGVEHIRGTSRRGFSPKMSELRRSYRDVVDLLGATGMTLTPTIVIQGGFPVLAARDAWWVDDPRMRLFPLSVREAGRVMRDRPPNAQELAAREALVIPQERLVADVVRAGGRVIAGTDSPIHPYGVALLSELEHFVRGGLSPAEALRAATSIAADAMGLGADLGTVEPGKLADLVIVDGNPLATFTDLRRTVLTIKNGVVYEVSSLIAAR